MRTPQEHVETLGSSIDDTKTPTDHDGNAVNLKDTIDYIASQIADILGETAWETAPDEAISALAARAKLEDTLAEDWYDSLNSVTVPNGQNYMILTVAMLPSYLNKAIATTVQGLITAEAGTFGSQHNLDELAGDTAINPRNLVRVVDAASGDPKLDSNGKKIWALLQHEATATDNSNFTDTTPERAMVSFVVTNATHDDLVACAVADIEDAVVNLGYSRRKSLTTRVPQDWKKSSAFVDMPTGAASVTLNNAIDNQGVTPATQVTDIEIRIDDDSEWRFETSDGGRTLLAVKPAAAGDGIEVNADAVDFNVGAAGTFDVDNGITVDSGGTPINVGVTAGQIDAGAAALKVASTGAAVEAEGVGVTLDGTAGSGGPITIDGTVLDADFSGDADSHLEIDPNSATKRTLRIAAVNSGAAVADLELEADGDVLFETAQEITPIPLDDSTAGAISALTGGPHASIAAAIKYAIEHGVDITTKRFVIPSNYNKDVNVPAATLDLTAWDIDWAGGSPDLFLFLQGRILDGADAVDEGDCYPGTTPASGDLKFSFDSGVKSGWILLSLGIGQH
jgi:hypothetical protein